MILDIFLVVALVSVLWMVIGLQMRLKLARSEISDVRRRLVALEKKVNRSPEDYQP
jgi:uncharacterized protein YoxC